MNSKLEKFSPSMMIDYLNCPLSFYYKYISKIQLPTKQIHLVFGSAVHRAIEGIYNKEKPFELFIHTFDKTKLQDDEKDLHDEFLKLGEEMIKNYIEEHQTLDSLYNLSEGRSEIYIKDKLINPLTGEESSIPMSGRIDRMTNSGKIVEYKTSAKKWTEADVNYKIQTLLYNLWYFSKHGVLPEETLYIVLLKKFKKVGKGEVIQVLSKHCTIDELASTYDEVEIILNKINNGEFERPKGFHPSWCDCYRYERALNINQE